MKQDRQDGREDDQLWDSFSPNELPITDAQKALLDARLADMESNPDDQSHWHEVKARLVEQLLR